MCAACEAVNPDQAKFCLECGAAMAFPVRATEVRKTVTVLFCDVTGSTALGERLDPEAMRAVMRRYFAVMSTVVESHGGTVEKFIGDAVMAVFGVPVLHEDDALRALRAAHGMRGALEDLNVEQIGQVFTRSAALAQQDRAVECREALARGEVLLAETPSPLPVMITAFHGALAWNLLGEPREAERILRRGVDVMLGIGERAWLSSLAPMLGEVRLELGDAAEARTLAELGRESASPGDFGSQAQWRALLARLEALDGRLEAATALADEALSWIEQTDQIGWVAEVRVSRAEVHERAGRPDAARADLHVAVELLDRKGNLAGARRARARLEAIGS